MNTWTSATAYVIPHSVAIVYERRESVASNNVRQSEATYKAKVFSSIKLTASVTCWTCRLRLDNNTEKMKFKT